MPKLSVVLAGALAVAVAGVACSSDDKTPVTSTEVTVAETQGTFQVTGTATDVAAERALSEPIAPPFTIEVTERGNGGAEFTGVTVSGRASQIDWDTGRPLPVTGDGRGLNLNGAKVVISPGSIVWSLDGAPRDLLPGSYTLGSSVAVGTSGLGRPVDRVTFIAGDEATVTTSGDAKISMPAGSIRIEGTETLLVIVGKLRLAGPDGERDVARVNFGPGIYEVTLTLTDGAYLLDAKLEGRVFA